jgi:hypothetical protein
MMQTVNASLMKATVQDMQLYLHHLERLLGMDLHANPHRMDSLVNPHRMDLHANQPQSVSHNMEHPQNEQSVLLSHMERLSQSIRVLDIKIDSHMTAISELSNRISQVEDTQQELLAHSNNIPHMNINNDYQFDSPLLSATIADECTLLSSSAGAIFSSDSMQSITVCKMDAPVNEIVIPRELLINIPSVAIESYNQDVELEQNVPAVEAPAVEAPVVEAPKVVETPVVEAPKVVEVPKVVEAPVVEAPVVEAMESDVTIIPAAEETPEA